MSYLLSRLCFLLGLLLLLFPPQLMSTCNLIPLLDIPGFGCIGNLLCIYWSPYVSQRHPFLLSQCMQNDWNSATTARNFSWHFMVSTHHISASMLWMIVWAFHECVWKNEKVSRQCHITKYNYCRQLIHPFSSVYPVQSSVGNGAYSSCLRRRGRIHNENKKDTHVENPTYKEPIQMADSNPGLIALKKTMLTTTAPF